MNALFGNVLMTSDNINTYKDYQMGILAKSVDIFQNATEKSYYRDNNVIHISYNMEGKQYKIAYNTKNGVMKYYE